MPKADAKRQLSELGDGVPAHNLAFISYARESGAIAMKLSEGLERAGINTWIDREQLGDDQHTRCISERIWDALGEATDVVGVVCRSALSKPWVIHEWHTAAARWLATGSPRIHLVIADKGLELPGFPFTSLHHISDDVQTAISQAILHAERTDIPESEKQWEERVRRWRAEYLMGGPTAVRVLHQFSALWPSFRSLIDTCSAHGFGESSMPASFLAWLGPVLDLRVSRKWLCDALELACAAPTSPRIRGILRNNLGVASLYGGRFAKAGTSFEMAAEECIADNDFAGLAIALGNQALVSLELGQLGRMHNWVGRARRALERCGSHAGEDTEQEVLNSEALLRNHEARALLYEGRYADAKLAFLEQLGHAEALDSRRLIGVALGYVALVDILSGSMSFATTRWLDRYRHISLSSLNVGGVANSLNWGAIGSYSTGAASEALQSIDQEILLRVHRDEELDLRRALAWRRIIAQTARLHDTRPQLPDLNSAMAPASETSDADATLFAYAGVFQHPHPDATVRVKPKHAATRNYLSRMASCYQLPGCSEHREESQSPGPA